MMRTKEKFEQAQLLVGLDNHLQELQQQTAIQQKELHGIKEDLQELYHYLLEQQQQQEQEQGE